MFSSLFVPIMVSFVGLSSYLHMQTCLSSYSSSAETFKTYLVFPPPPPSKHGEASLEFQDYAGKAVIYMLERKSTPMPTGAVANCKVRKRKLGVLYAAEGRCRNTLQPKEKCRQKRSRKRICCEKTVGRISTRGEK
ncbi:uncharacterized protein K460DRAFT_100923 [Cucurbitaria berberidis CBS 394.84]|uniref:Secreted protein n=1 Tax=Cucurbitaria berberidis CBS 394.84 TaxID=1168544 RepID=A0A9P4L869_9PLEO|nr:uncharacterized protein K460DRAFT_100923 [Cucurbitaria berberidis CBS 394.84]KAF1844943.1 hypothetical protein K460DRAFT_100923 [Cucurbitaria berberidis CBS 394.84]